MWYWYLEWAEENKWEYLYLAQIAAECRRGWVKEPGKVKARDFVLSKKVHDDKKEMSVEEQTRRAKMFFAGLIAASRKDTDGSKHGSRKSDSSPAA